MTGTSYPPDVSRRLGVIERKLRDLERKGGSALNMRDLRDGAELFDVEDGDVPVYRKDAGRWRPENVRVQFGTTVVAENLFGGQASAVGGATTAAKSDHTHGTPLARHPQTGVPYVDFSGGGVVLGRRSGEHMAGVVSTTDKGTSEVTWMASPVGVDGWGRAGLEMYGVNDGGAVVKMFNDLDTGGAYGEPNTGNPSRPLRFELIGTMEFHRDSAAPAVAEPGRARLYVNASGKLQLSENGGGFRNIGGDMQFGTTVVAETTFSQVSAVGGASTAARSDHTHGTPLPRHPQTGFPFVDFSTGGVILGRRSGEHLAGFLSTTDKGTSELTWLASPVGVNGWGRAGLEMYGLNDGTALVKMFNDLDTNGVYGDPGTGAVSRPLRFELVGAMDFLEASTAPPVAEVGRARLKYNASTGKLQISENGGSYRDIGGGDVGTGAAGTFLVTDSAGTGRRWTGATEFVVTGGQVGVGVAPTATMDVNGSVFCNGFRVPRASGNDGIFFTTDTNGDPVWAFGTPNSTQFLQSFIGSQGVHLSLGGGNAANGDGRPLISLLSSQDLGTRARISFFNDLKTNGTYGSGGAAARSAEFRFHGGDFDSYNFASSIMKIYTDTTRTSFGMQSSGVANIIRVQNGYAGFMFVNFDDATYVPLTASAFTVGSARETKKNIRALSASATPDIMAIKCRTFERPGQRSIEGGDRGPATSHVGLVADEVAGPIPEAVSYVDGKPNGIDFVPITVKLIKTVQELAHRLDLLEAV